MERLSLSEAVVRGTVLAQLPPYEFTPEGQFNIIPVVRPQSDWSGPLGEPRNWWFEENVR